MTRTPTVPADDKNMWRRAKARVHPDAGGDHELFVWLGSIQELVCSSRERSTPEPRPSYQAGREHSNRVSYPPVTDFDACTRTALKMGACGMPYGSVLSLLADCEPPPVSGGASDQRGASYKKLAAIGHLVGMTKKERIGWYRVAEEIPLSDRHASHILGRLKRRTS